MFGGIIIGTLCLIAVIFVSAITVVNKREAELDSRCYPQVRISAYQDLDGSWKAVCADTNGNSVIK